MSTPLSASLEKLFARDPSERRIGRYRLRADAKLGQGGFAPVFLADELTDEASDETLQTVALKLFALDENRARITREGQALCKVKHDNVVTFNTMITDEALGVVAIVMEHVEGTPVDARVEKGRLPVKDVIALGEQMASALETIHAAGIIHRDLKPANIIEHGGVYTLIDFGISHGEGAAAAPIPATEAREMFAELARGDAHGLTGVMHAAQKATKATLLTHGIAGTLGYVDPRTVVGGVRADEKSDLYALGVTLYECASGVLPTVAAAGETEITPEHRAEVSAKIFAGDEPPPSLSDVCPDVPLALASLIDAMVSPGAADRPANAAAVRERLRKVREDLAEAAQKPTRSVAPAAAPPRTGIQVGSTPLSAEEQRQRDEAIRKRDSKERFARWRNRVLALLVLGGLGVGGYFGWKAFGGPGAAEKDARNAWADFQSCLLSASPADANANVARWYVVRANMTTGLLDPKVIDETCMPLGKTAYDTFRTARGPGSPFLEKLSDYLDRVTHNGVVSSDPIPMLNAGLDADLKGGEAKTPSPSKGLAEPTLKISTLQSAKASAAISSPKTDRSKCDQWMPPSSPIPGRYPREVSFIKRTGLLFGKKNEKAGRIRSNSDDIDEEDRWLQHIDTIVKLADDGSQRVCDYDEDYSTDAVKLVCNTPLFLVKRAKGAIELATVRSAGATPVPFVSIFPNQGRPLLQARMIDVADECHTSSRSYFLLNLSGVGARRTLFATWTDGNIDVTEIEGSGSLECLEGSGAWVTQSVAGSLSSKDSQSTMIFCPEGAACSAPQPVPKDPPPVKSPNPEDAKYVLSPRSCFDGKAWYSVVGEQKFSVGVRRTPWPFDKPGTTTLVFANTPESRDADLPTQLQCLPGAAVLMNGSSVAVSVSDDPPRILP